MPKISYQEIVTADVSESGTVTHEWIFNIEHTVLSHYVDKVFEFEYVGTEAKIMLEQLCQSKKYQTSEKDLLEKKSQKSKSKNNLNLTEKLTTNHYGTSQLTMEFR